MSAQQTDHIGMVSHAVTLGLASVLASTWVGLIPPIVAALASLLALVWYAIQIWESDTVKRWRRALGWRVPEDYGGFGQ